MRLANVDGRATLLNADCIGLDVEKASNGSFTADPQLLYERWDAFLEWAEDHIHLADTDVDPDNLAPPTPSPKQIFAIGLNYDDHVAEAQLGRPESPTVFTKFVSAITGPNATVNLPCATVDWEVELVAVIGRGAYRVSENSAWTHVAGLMVGQDLSERVLQLSGPVPQFSLGKSYLGFAPIGPWLVTLESFVHPEDLELGCRIGDEVVQAGRTSDMIFSVPELISRVSAICPLLPGDIIFTGTPAGVGHARMPPRFLKPGEVLTSHIEGIGELRNAFVAEPRNLSSSDQGVRHDFAPT